MGNIRLTRLEQETLMAIRREIYQNNQLTINELADKYFVSPALISKLAKKLGYRGYSDMMFYLNKEANKKTERDLVYKEECRKMASILYEYRDGKILLLSDERHVTVRDYLVRRMTMFDLFVVSTYDYQMVDSPTDLRGLTIGICNNNFQPIAEIMEYSHDANHQTVLLTTSNQQQGYSYIDFEFQVNNTGILEADIISFIEFVMSEYANLLWGEEK